MKRKQGGGKKVLAVLGVIVLVLAVVLAVYHETVRVLFYSVVDTPVKLDVSGDWAGGKTYRNVQYADVSETDYLNLYVPDSSEPSPLIVMIHGGGFVSNDCESRQAQLFYQYFRDHGYACATVNYRLAQEAPFPAAIEDVKAAVRYLRANADTYGYNADRIAVWGESAGGYLAVMAGVTTDEEFNSLPFIGEELRSEPVSAKVDVILDFYGATELESTPERRAAFRALDIHVPEFGYALANAWLTDAIKDEPESEKFENFEDFWLRKQVSQMTKEERNVFTPAYYVARNLPGRTDLDVLIVHGDADFTVPVSQSWHLYDQLVDTIGEAHVRALYIHNAKHAGDKIYTEENLGAVKAYLDSLAGI